MKRLFSILTVLLCFSVGVFGQVPGGYAVVANTMISDSLQSMVDNAKVPGAVGAILDSNGVLASGVFGKRNISAKAEMKKDDQLHLGSCTKAMTATMLATLVKDGKLTWESTVIGIFPELKDSIDKSYHQVTLWQLLTHTGGVARNAENWFAYSTMPKVRDQRYQLLKSGLMNASGLTKGEFNYSNLGYMIAGCMAEQVTGKSWEELMRKRLFEPLDMKSAGFGPPGTLGKADQPWGHNKVDGKWEAVQMDNAEALGPAGTVHCTLEDWARFIALQLKSGDTKLLSRDQLNQLVTPTGDYAAGWIVQERSWANGKVITHNGSNSTWYATVWVAPKKNRAYVVVTNSYDDQSQKVCDQMVAELLEIDAECSKNPYGE